ncbi:hypothetical protein QUF64_12585 [Anaerolineales bacterium HSG6]|nr:hypothetical protein [Anaerolineales bacterium HSG6]MDM8530865.1 hypothetical protein [Anaerolineales bacterium HSG25]
MLNLSDLLTELQFVTYEFALLGLFVTASFIIASRDWRSLIMALLVQYIFVGLILARIVRPDIAFLKIMVGAFICPGLFLSARQVSISALSMSMPRQTGHKVTFRERLSLWWRNFSVLGLLRGIERYQETRSTGFVFRLLLILLIILISMRLSGNYPLPDLAPNVTTAVYWLILAGLATLTLTENPIQVGHGVLTVFMGFDLYYSTLEPSFLIIGLWATVNLLTALAIGYLIIARGAAPEDDI